MDVEEVQGGGVDGERSFDFDSGSVDDLRLVEYFCFLIAESREMNALRLRGMGETVTFNLRFLQGSDIDFLVVPDEDKEDAEVLHRSLLPLRVLNSLRRLFFASEHFFAHRALGVSFSSHSRSTIFCLKLLSHTASSYSSFG